MITILSKEMILSYYYDLYFYNLQLLNQKLFYKFLSISELYSNIETNYNTDTDLFLLNLNGKKLGQDIIQKGMFWPFFATQKQDKYYILEGKHRFESLLLCKEEIIDKKFLCFILPENLDILRTIKDENKYYNFDINNNIVLVDTNSLYDSYINFIQFGMKLSNLIYKTNRIYPNYIKPNPILNNDLLFKYHINES